MRVLKKAQKIQELKNEFLTYSKTVYSDKAKLEAFVRNSNTEICAHCGCIAVTLRDQYVPTAENVRFY